MPLFEWADSLLTGVMGATCDANYTCVCCPCCLQYGHQATCRNYCWTWGMILWLSAELGFNRIYWSDLYICRLRSTMSRSATGHTTTSSTYCVDVALVALPRSRWWRHAITTRDATRHRLLDALLLQSAPVCRPTATHRLQRAVPADLLTRVLCW